MYLHSVAQGLLKLHGLMVGNPKGVVTITKKLRGLLGVKSKLDKPVSLAVARMLQRGILEVAKDVHAKVRFL